MSLTDRDAQAFIGQALSSPVPNTIRRAEGIWVEDHQGRRFMDFHGNSVHHLGYGHPKILAAIRAQLDELSFAPRTFTCEPAVELAETLARVTPGALGKSLFLPSGSDAVETALRLARAATGRWKTVSFWGSYHGSGFAASAVGGDPVWRNAATGPLPTGAEHVEQYDCGNCPFGHHFPDGQPDFEICGRICADQITRILRREGDIAAVVAEPMRSFPTVPPEGFWRQVRAACDATGTLLIFDEVPTGLGKTGKMFACEHEHVVPDILVLGKSLGGGVLPLAAVVADPRLDVAQPWSVGHFTHEKNPVTTRVGKTVLDILEDEALPERAAELGREALSRLQDMCVSLSRLRLVRGRGLLLGVDVVDPVSGAADPRTAQVIREKCLNAGLNFKVSGGATIVLSPPLIIGRVDLFRALEILIAAVSELPDD